jgi:predicted transcriptional regulator
MIKKHLEETEITNNLIVYSQRTAFIYGEECNEMECIAIEDFLVNILRERGPISRGELASLTNIPRTTLYDILSKLISKGKVKKKPAKREKRGRPEILFSVRI